MTNNIIDIKVNRIWNQNEICILMSTNETYLPFLGVWLESFIENRDNKRNADIIVMTDEQPKDISKIEEMLDGEDNISIRFVAVGSLVSGVNLFTGNRPDISKEAYFRLLSPYVCDEYDKLLYMDCDLIINEDISELYDLDIGDYYAAAVRDTVGIGIYNANIGNRHAYYDDELEFGDYTDYFNSGVMLLNLKRLREWGDRQKYIDFMTSRDWQFHDQDILNIICRGNVMYLSPKWNCVAEWKYDKYLPKELYSQVKEAQKNPCIVHFAGNDLKPWNRISYLSLRYFWPVAQRSPYLKYFLSKYNLEKRPIIADIISGREAMVGEAECKIGIDGSDSGTVGKYGSSAGKGNQRSTEKKREMEKMAGFGPFSKKKQNKCQDSKATENVEMTAIRTMLFQQQQLTLQLMMQVEQLEAKIDGKSRKEIDERTKLLAATMGNPNAIKRCQPRKQLAVEIDIAAKCNLNCKSCAHYSPIAKEEYADIEQTKNDLRQLSMLCDGEVEYIHLMGGEPLLNPNVLDFAIAARESFPTGRIEIVTNGLLLDKKDKAFFQTLHDYKIQLSVTKYPIDARYEDMRAMAVMHGVDFKFYNNSARGVHFKKLELSESESGEKEENFANCYLANECIQLKNGRLFPCSLAGRAYRLDEAFGTSFSNDEENGIDIYSVSTKDELLMKLARPIPFCRHCKVCDWNEIEWGMSTKDKSEWL